MQLTILADDHTGACDAGAPFAAANLPVRVFFDFKAWQPLEGVSAISFQCRNLPIAETTSRLAWWREAHQTPHNVFVKIDSTLAEGSGLFLEAALQMLQPASAVLCPANPVQGRTIAGGELRVHGESTGQLWRRWIKDHAPANAIIPEPVESDADLDAIVQRYPRATLCGSAGLAAAMARSGKAGPNPIRELPKAKEIAVFCGSQQAASLEQLHRLSAAAIPNVSIVNVPRDSPQSALQSWPQDWLKAGRGIILVGGDTAGFVAGHFHIDWIDLCAEPASGLVAGVTQQRALVAAKPGGFGQPDTLIQGVRALRMEEDE